MRISCSRCGKIHERGKCEVKRHRVYESRTPEQKYRSSGSWQRVTRIVRDRDDNLCQACLHESPPRYTGDSLEVHHIVPLREDWSLRAEPDNAVCLCVTHHKLAEVGMIDRQTLQNWVIESTERSAS